MSTFGLAVRGTGGTTAAATTQIGSAITLPAGGPWLIHNVWGNVSKKTTIPDQGTGGQLVINSRSGDVRPDPAPGKYPMIGNAISSSANAGFGIVSLSNWPVAWEGSGKAVLELSYMNQLAITTGSHTSAGVIFGDTLPEKRPHIFCDGVYSSFASATETLIGSITLSEKSTRITGILADLNKGDAATAGETCHGTIRLQSNDVLLAPGEFPCNRAFDATDGTAVGAPSNGPSEFIPVDIPVPSGAIINVYGTTTESVTANADFSVFLAYE
jgi:hypothetical protein